MRDITTYLIARPETLYYLGFTERPPNRRSPTPTKAGIGGLGRISPKA
jgi:hypothetical protein